MKIDVVDFSGGGDAVKAIYVGGNLEANGDYYHDHIDEYVDGWISGIKFLVECNLDFSIEINYHSLTEDSADQFAEDGFDFPAQFPNKYIEGYDGDK